MHEALWQPQREPADAELRACEVGLSFFLAAEWPVAERGSVAQHGGPSELEAFARDLLLERVGVESVAEESADDRAHARARDDVDRDAQLFEHAQHADVRDAARAATAQHESDARSLSFFALRLLCSERRREHRRQHQKR